jgi:hypothetical protein
VAISLAIAGGVSAWRVRFHPGVFRVPLLNSFRSSNRWWMIVALAVAVLAGYFVDGILRHEAKPRAAIIVAGSCAVSVLSFAILFTVFRRTAETLIRSSTEFAGLPAGFFSSWCWFSTSISMLLLRLSTVLADSKRISEEACRSRQDRR